MAADIRRVSDPANGETQVGRAALPAARIRLRASVRLTPLPTR